jgi:hypothetical protein
MVGAEEAAWGGVAGQPEEVVAFVQGQAQVISSPTMRP